MRWTRSAIFALSTAALAVGALAAGAPLAAHAATGHQAAPEAALRVAVYDCANQPQVRPRTFDLFCDGSGAFTRLTWSTWNASTATATGSSPRSRKPAASRTCARPRRRPVRQSRESASPDSRRGPDESKVNSPRTAETTWPGRSFRPSHAQPSPERRPHGSRPDRPRECYGADPPYNWPAPRVAVERGTEPVRPG